MTKNIEQPIGISDIGVHVPSPVIDLENLVRERVKIDPKLARHLERAVQVTGQRSIRFPDLWEDTATMAAQAAFDLLRRNPNLDLSRIRHLSVGTETTVDHSKPVSAYVQGMLPKAGVHLPDSLSSFQVQHACAGATMSLLSVGGLLSMGARHRESGIVIASDIARYDTETTAEITQGAGAVALLVETAPRLLELDISSIGLRSRDVDDFFRPLGSKTAKVKGRYSMECYLDSLEAAFLDHCRRAERTPDQALSESDLIVLHTPFRNMPESALHRLLEKYLGFRNGNTESFLRERGFYQGVDPLANIGNLYNGSLYLALAFLLFYRYRELGDRIAGKRVLLASYGSGNTMIVLSGRVAASAPEVLASWDLDQIFASARQATMEEYNAWVAGPYDSAEYAARAERLSVPGGSFYMARIREDGYREYRYAAELRDWLPEREAPVDLQRSVPVLR